MPGVRAPGLYSPISVNAELRTSRREEFFRIASYSIDGKFAFFARGSFFSTRGWVVGEAQEGFRRELKPRLQDAYDHS